MLNKMISMTPRNDDWLIRSYTGPSIPYQPMDSSYDLWTQLKAAQPGKAMVSDDHELLEAYLLKGQTMSDKDWRYIKRVINAMVADASVPASDILLAADMMYKYSRIPEKKVKLYETALDRGAPLTTDISLKLGLSYASLWQKQVIRNNGFSLFPPQ